MSSTTMLLVCMHFIVTNSKYVELDSSLFEFVFFCCSLVFSPKMSRRVCIPLAIVNVNDFHFCSSQLCWWSLTFLYALQMWFDPSGRKTTFTTFAASHFEGKKFLTYLWFNTTACTQLSLSLLSAHALTVFHRSPSLDSRITHCITFCLFAFSSKHRFFSRSKYGYKLKEKRKRTRVTK